MKKFVKMEDKGAEKMNELKIFKKEEFGEMRESRKSVKGFKVFNPDWVCRGKQYTCPGHFEENVDPSVCDRGMHFCKKIVDCFKYYQFRPENRVAEVVAYGTVVEDGDKCSTDKLEIVREIPWTELIEIINTGNGCTGKCNSGKWNSGNNNSGKWNSGNNNSGRWNSGDYNSGYYNTGDYNSGDHNTGDYNSGRRNSGDYNSGDCNSGSWNKTHFSNGCFNTVEPKIYLFNKPSEWTYQDWLTSDACHLMDQIPKNVLEYVMIDNMTDEEKAEHPEAKITGGYLKETDNSKHAVTWWRGLNDNQKDIIKAIPNFDKAIFKEITGIDVDEY